MYVQRCLFFDHPYYRMAEIRAFLGGPLTVQNGHLPKNDARNIITKVATVNQSLQHHYKKRTFSFIDSVIDPLNHFSMHCCIDLIFHWCINKLIYWCKDTLICDRFIHCIATWWIDAQIHWCIDTLMHCCVEIMVHYW